MCSRNTILLCRLDLEQGYWDTSRALNHFLLTFSYSTITDHVPTPVPQCFSDSLMHAPDLGSLEDQLRNVNSGSSVGGIGEKVNG